MISRIRKNFFYYIFPLNAIADILVNLIPNDFLHIGEVRGFILLLYVLITLPLFRKDKTNLSIFLFLIYLIPLLILSSNFLYSLSTYLKMSLGLLMFPVAYSIIKELKDLKRFFFSLIITCSIYVLGAVIFEGFGLGQSVYYEGSFETFGGTAKFTQIIVYAIIAFPVSLKLVRMKRRRLYLIIHLLGGIIVFLVFHRTSIVGLVAGYMIFAYFNKGSRAKIVFSVSLFALVGFTSLYFVAPNYFDKFMEISSNRDITFQDQMDERYGRAAEFALVSRILSNGSLEEVLFGKELFNGGSFLKIYNRENIIRPMHVDYFIVFLGSGIIGSILYILMYYFIVKKFLWLRRFINSDLKYNFSAAFFGILIASLIHSASNQIWSTSSLAVVFGYFGSLIGYLEYNYFSSLSKIK